MRFAIPAHPEIVRSSNLADDAAVIREWNRKAADTLSKGGCKGGGQNGNVIIS
jgi:hypothetical protein